MPRPPEGIGRGHMFWGPHPDLPPIERAPVFVANAAAARGDASGLALEGPRARTRAAWLSGRLCRLRLNPDSPYNGGFHAKVTKRVVRFKNNPAGRWCCLREGTVSLCPIIQRVIGRLNGRLLRAGPGRFPPNFLDILFFVSEGAASSSGWRSVGTGLADSQSRKTG